MCIKLILLSTALFNIVIPSEFPFTDPVAVLETEFHRKFPHAPIPNIHGIANVQEEIFAPKLHFTPEMPFLNALSMAASLPPDQIHQSMLPIIHDQQLQPGSEALRILHKVFQPKLGYASLPISFEDAVHFSVLFESVFPRYGIDLYQACMDGDVPRLDKRCGNTLPNTMRVRLFSQANGLWRAMMPKPFIPHAQPPMMNHMNLHQIPHQPLTHHDINQWRYSVNNDKPRRQPGKTRSRYASKRQQNSPPQNDKMSQNVRNTYSSTHITNHYNQQVEGGKAGISNPAKSTDGKSQKPSRNAKDKKGSKSDEKKKSAKDTKDAKGNDKGFNNRKKWIIGGIIAALVVIPCAGFGIYKAVNTKRSQPSNQARSAQRSGDSNV